MTNILLLIFVLSYKCRISHDWVFLLNFHDDVRLPFDDCFHAIKYPSTSTISFVRFVNFCFLFDVVVDDKGAAIILMLVLLLVPWSVGSNIPSDGDIVNEALFTFASEICLLIFRFFPFFFILTLLSCCGIMSAIVDVLLCVVDV